MPADLVSEENKVPTVGDLIPPSPQNHTPNPAHNTPGAGRKRRVMEWGIEHVLMLVGLTAVLAMILVMLFMLKDALPLFFQDHQPISKFLFGINWRPTSTPEEYGILSLIVGSAIVTAGAAILAIPIGFACAIYLAELAPRIVREILKPTVELLAAIPSVVMGFIGLSVLNPWLRVVLHLDTGMIALAASIMLALMAMPTVISIAEDALSSVPQNYREGSLALGTSTLSTIRHSVLPAARSGLIAAAMLGIGRALGETMTVLMVAGMAIRVPLEFLGDNTLPFVEKMSQLVHCGFGFFQPARTMTASIASDMGETAVGSAHFHALFAVGALLCLISFLITLVSDFALRRERR